MLDINNLTVMFGNRVAVQDINISVKKGDILGIVGPNGAGKTTLFRAILGLQRQNKGTVKLFGYEKNRLSLLPLISYVPQNISFEQNFPATVSDVVRMGMIEKRYMSKAVKLIEKHDFEWKKIYGNLHTDKERILETLKITGISNLKDQRIGDISGGEMQRVLIAKALIKDPLLLILDEPVTSVDVDAQIKFYDIITRINKENDITVVWSSHDLDALSKYATRIACMSTKLFFHGSKKKFFSDSKLLGMYSESIMQSHLHSHKGEEGC